jgi:hypothetical protein
LKIEGRPEATGYINNEETEGSMTFPDDRTWSFEFDIKTETIYWGGRMSGYRWIRDAVYLCIPCGEYERVQGRTSTGTMFGPMPGPVVN